MINKIKCFFCGHKPVPMLNETALWMHIRGCERCGTALGLPKMNLKHFSPPNSTLEQIKEWERFCETEWAKARAECLAKIEKHKSLSHEVIKSKAGRC